MQQVLSWENSFIFLCVASCKSKESELSERRGTRTCRRQRQRAEKTKREGRIIPWHQMSGTGDTTSAALFGQLCNNTIQNF